MFVDINTFIKIDFIKKEMLNNSTLITNTDEADQFAYDVCNGKLCNVIFEKSSLKEYCLNKIGKMNHPIDVINCNTNITRFCEDLNNVEGTIVFDNVNKCKDIEVLKIIYNQKGIMIC